MATDQILNQISNSLGKIQDDVTSIKVDNASLNCTLKHLTENWQSDHETIKNHAAKIEAFEKSFFKTLTDIMKSINDNHNASKDYTDIKIDGIKKKIEELQGWYVKSFFIISSISSGVGATVMYVINKFPLLAKLFNG